MATLTEFTIWLDDFGKRFPAVADYASKHDQDNVLINSWCETLQAFTADTLRDVTRNIVAGKLATVDNFKLGTFADEIRIRARTVVEWARQGRKREELREMPAHLDESDPGSMQDMICHAVACDQLMSERTGRPIDTSCRRWQRPHGVQPDEPYDAAIILADKHTDMERRDALATLERHGLTWEMIQQRAVDVRRRGVSLFKEVPDGNVS